MHTSAVAWGANRRQRGFLDPLERINKAIKRRNRVVGTSPTKPA